MIAVGKKIVILNGSPRRKGNTSMLVKAFAEGADLSGGEGLRRGGAGVPRR